MINADLPPEPSSLAEVQESLEAVRTEHARLSGEIEEARKWLSTQKAQEKQLNDFSDFLAKDQLRIKEWEQHVLEQEQNLNTATADLKMDLDKHLEQIKDVTNTLEPQTVTRYTLIAETGDLEGKMS